MLEGRNFPIYTDYKPFTMSMNSNSDKYTSQEIKHLVYVSQVSTNTHNIKDKDNIVADTVSRVDITTLADVITESRFNSRRQTKIRLRDVRTSISHYKNYAQSLHCNSSNSQSPSEMRSSTVMSH